MKGKILWRIFILLEGRRLLARFSIFPLWPISDNSTFARQPSPCPIWQGKARRLAPNLTPTVVQNFTTIKIGIQMQNSKTCLVFPGHQKSWTLTRGSFWKKKVGSRANWYNISAKAVWRRVSDEGKNCRTVESGACQYVCFSFMYSRKKVRREGIHRSLVG